ncbi:MAG: hypothetical protein LUQ71_10540 [Methanoregula sp.]|nr:hypothetical protein [Methanoregula sp.]
MVLVILFIIVYAGSTAVSARYITPEGTNAGISPGDTVFNYEQYLNFSVFRTSNGLPPTAMAAKDSGSNPIQLQPLKNAVLVNYIDAGKYANQPYYPYNTTDSTWGTSSIIITDATIGDIQIRPVYTDVTPPSTDTPLTTIPYDMNVQFRLQSTNLNSGNFAGPWYKYELTTQSRTISQVVNAVGDTVSLTDLTEDPTSSNNTLAFSMQGQNIADSDLASSFSMKFQTQLQTASNFPTKTLSFRVKKFTLAANFSPSSTQMGQDVTLRIYGKPYTYYTAVVDSSVDGAPQFPTTGTYDIYTSQYNVTVHPGPAGFVNVTLHVPSTSGDYSSTYRLYYTTVYETDTPTRSVTAQLGVGGSGGGNTTTSVKLKNPNLKINEFFTVGDTIIIPLTVGSDVSTVYFFMTGPNTCPNGVKPSQPWVCAVDGDEDTFDVLPVDSTTDNYFTWDTVNTSIASGTYRIFGVITPTGYTNRTLAVGNAQDYTDIDLTTPSINAKFPDEAPGFFAKGDYVASLWTARGSPAKTGYYGMIRWYILGTNFRYTGITQFPLLKVDGSNPSEEELETLVKGGHDFPGYSGLDFGRNFSYSLDSGDYYVVYQHPMYNNAFDLYPSQGAAYTGTFGKLLTSTGQSVDISTMQTSDALTAMLRLLNQSKIDDSLLQDHFTIQDSIVTLNPLLNYEVGDDIPVTGKTNLEQSVSYSYNQISHPADKLTFWVYSSEMYYAGKTQSTYRIYSTDGTISSLAPGATKRSVSFDIPAAITAQMKPGEYVAVVSCEDIKYTNTITFVLHEQGYRKKNGLAEPAKGAEFTSSSQNLSVSVPSATRTVAAARTAGSTRKVTTIPTTKSPGFSVAVTFAASTLVAVFYCLRRRHHEP